MILNPKDMARDVFSAIRAYVQKAMAPVIRRIEQVEQKHAELSGALHGLSQSALTQDALQDHIEESFNKFSERDLTAGERKELLDGMQPYIEAAHKAWAIDWERNATELMLKAIANIPEPQNGKDGEDGKDALELEDFDVELKDEGRVLMLKFCTGERQKVREIPTGMVIYRDVFSKAEKYQRGDSVTYAGSLWIARKDNPGTPGDGDGWRLAAKRGRDGKDAQ